MKDIYRNPTFYYILVPALIAIWPLCIWLVYLPRAEARLEDDRKAYVAAGEVMKRILALDPTRLEFSPEKISEDKFDYAGAVEKAAAKCGILPTSCNMSVKPPRTTRDQKTQEAAVHLVDVDITTFAKFLTSVQMTWPNLQCEQIDLNKKKGAVADQWNIDLRFKYYY